MGISNQRLKGVLITTLGVVFLAPDALIIRLVSADLWTLFFWRCLFMSLGMGLVAVLKPGRNGRFSTPRLGRLGRLAALIYAANNLCFVIAVTHTTAANVFAIIGLAPLCAALLGLVCIGERVPRRTWVAIALCLGGVAIIFSGSIEGGGLFGDLFAVVTAITMAGFFVCLRCDPEIDNFALVSVSTLISAVLVLPMAAPATITGAEVVYLFLAGVVITPLSIGLITVGPRYIAAAEVSLIMLLEMLLSPLLIWFTLGEVPAPRTFIGGGLLLLTLLIHSLIGVRGGNGEELDIALPDST